MSHDNPREVYHFSYHCPPPPLLPVRATLGLFVCLSFAALRRAVRTKLGSTVSVFLTIITVCQFHFLFYASRPLPNTFALILGKTYMV